MTTYKRGEVVARIIEALAEDGPMTRTQIAEATGVPRGIVSPVLSRMHRPTVRPVAPKRIYVAGWQDEEEGERSYPRALYALGAHDDEPKPAGKRRKVSRREYDEANYKQAISSVFDLAMNRDQRNDKRRKLRVIGSI